MNREEIDYWLRTFSNYNQSFMSKDGKKITLFKVFQELKELQHLLKIQNDYINELEQENQELKKQLEEKQNPFKGIYAQIKDDDFLREFGNMNIEINELKNHQKEFIDYMSKTIEELETDDVGDEELKGYLIQEIDIFKEILSKYKEIIEK